MAKNIKKRIAFILLSLNIFLASCSVKNNHDNTFVSTTDDFSNDSGYEQIIPKQELPVTEEPLVEIIESIYEDRPFTEEELRILNQKFNVSNNDMQNFIQIIKEYKVTYPYEELYSGKASRVFDYKPQISEFKIIKNGKIDADLLYKQVIENNQEYAYVNAYKKTTDSFVREVCEEIATQLNSYLQRGICDAASLEEKLQFLKVYSYNDFASGYYNPNKGILAINYTNETKEIINHEIAHIPQYASKKDLEETNMDNRMGYLYKENGSAINPFLWLWFSEASAEGMSLAYNSSVNPNVYNAEYQMLEGLKLINFDNTTNLEETLFQTDIGALYNYFDADTYEEQQEINKMFYAATILFNDYPSQEGLYFYQYLRDNLGIEMSVPEKRVFKENLTGLIALGESKLFYRNLARKITNQGITLNELFSIIATFELELSRQTWYNSKFDSMEDFLAGYTEIQTSFFTTLQNYINVDISELKQLYYMFSISGIEKSYPSWLSENEKSYLNYINDSRNGNKKSAIIKIYEDNFTQSVKR